MDKGIDSECVRKHYVVTRLIKVLRPSGAGHLHYSGACLSEKQCILELCRKKLRFSWELLSIMTVEGNSNACTACCLLLCEAVSIRKQYPW